MPRQKRNWHVVAKKLEEQLGAANKQLDMQMRESIDCRDQMAQMVKEKNEAVPERSETECFPFVIMTVIVILVGLAGFFYASRYVVDLKCKLATEKLERAKEFQGMRSVNESMKDALDQCANDLAINVGVRKRAYIALKDHHQTKAMSILDE